ncbi:MAG: hypothetical protein R3B89_06735 [Polyangiaceae bacterium]
MWLDVVLVLVALALLGCLLWPKLRDNELWRATVTPLASIIGSGFLVVVPLLGHAVGVFAPIAIIGVVLIAYVIGTAVRFNIKHAEELLGGDDAPRSLRWLEDASDLALSASYVVSVAFYLSLLASFVLKGIGHESQLVGRIITTLILGLIGVSGFFKGLKLLERLEEYSVSVKLSIILALLVGWFVYDTGHLGDVPASHITSRDPWHLARVLAGVLIVVQGFETSRYLGDEYSAEKRVKTMRWAQLIAGAIYIAFLTLTLPTLKLLPDSVDETAVIDLSSAVASVLPAMLVVAAVMSQFSAAVADTVGAGGLLEQSLGEKLPRGKNLGYALVAGAGIALVWTCNIFTIVALASRAFAIYYALQATIAAKVAGTLDDSRHRGWVQAAFAGLAVLLVGVAVIAIPAG